MALLQDIEKAVSALSKQITDCNNDDLYSNTARKMKDCRKESMEMKKFLEGLAKDVKQGNQKELTKDQEKQFDKLQDDMASASVYVLWNQTADWSPVFAKGHSAIVDAFKKIK